MMVGRSPILCVGNFWPDALHVQMEPISVSHCVQSGSSRAATSPRTITHPRRNPEVVTFRHFGSSSHIRSQASAHAGQPASIAHCSTVPCMCTVTYMYSASSNVLWRIARGGPWASKLRMTAETGVVAWDGITLLLCFDLANLIRVVPPQPLHSPSRQAPPADRCYSRYCLYPREDFTVQSSPHRTTYCLGSSPIKLDRG